MIVSGNKALILDVTRDDRHDRQMCSDGIASGGGTGDRCITYTVESEYEHLSGTFRVMQVLQGF